MPTTTTIMYNLKFRRQTLLAHCASCYLPYLHWRFCLCLFASAWFNCHTFATWRVKKISPGASTNCSYTSASKAVTAFAACIHVNTCSAHSRFPENKNTSCSKFWHYSRTLVTSNSEAKQALRTDSISPRMYTFASHDQIKPIRSKI